MSYSKEQFIEAVGSELGDSFAVDHNRIPDKEGNPTDVIAVYKGGLGWVGKIDDNLLAITEDEMKLLTKSIEKAFDATDTKTAE